jgi:hypothetical protein
MSVISAQMAKKLIIRPETEEAGEMVITSRPSSTAVLAVDSADRYAVYPQDVSDTTNAYSFTISRNQALMNGFFRRIALTEFVFPYYIPNINTETNALYFKKNGGATTTAYLPVGFYTPSQLATAVQALLIANGFAAATCVYNPANTIAPATFNLPCSFLIKTNTADTIQFVRGSGAPGATDTTLAKFQLFDLMALNDEDDDTINGGITRCRYLEYIDVICSQLTYNQELKDTMTAPLVRDILARIYIETENDQPVPVSVAGASTAATDTIPGTYPFTIYRQFDSPKQILWNKAQTIGNLTFELYDNHGQLLRIPLTPGGGADDNSFAPNWRMTLLVSEN